MSEKRMIYLCKAREEYADQSEKGLRPSPFVPWYDLSFGFVVIAESEAQARQFCSEEYDDNADVWLDSKYTTCEELPGELPSGIVLKDYKSA